MLLIAPCTSTTAAFPKDYRLKTPAEFRAVFKCTPKRLQVMGLTVLYVKNGKQHPRLGMAIAKRHIKHAVLRNRLKRLIREVFRQNASKLAGYDMVIMVNRLVRSADEWHEWLFELSQRWRLLSK